MPNKMLIDASHPEETRVVVVRGSRIEEFDFESQDKKQLKGNIYLARVTRVEPSLQAAFVEYGGNRHGFLAFSEIHPDYYQIPVADRQALLRAEAEAHQDEDDEENEEREGRGRGRRRRRGGRRSEAQGPSGENGSSEGSTEAAGSPDEDGEDGETADRAIALEATDGETVSESAPAADGDDDGDDEADGTPNGDDAVAEIESVGAEDAMEEVRERRRPVRRQYKIQEVIKRRQIMLVQVVKEERGNKGAALTTYLSLAGRYSVLMPNTARGGGISRKITSIQDRKRLKDIVKDLDVPQGMGVILRTAGESRTKAEIKRDYEYLTRLWFNVRELTLNSIAPSLVYEEGSLIKRSIRDLYNKDIDEILVAGEDGYREAKDFMRMLMPSHAKMVQPYRDNVPIFARSGIEGQLDKMLQPQVTLKSGGYVIINQTEALVAIDVNSGRSTREHSIEDTALQTNLEAAEEVARQLRLRDLAGLIVIDFIDMEENRNNRAVEKKLKECLKNDRARIQVGRISHFGLLEMSRQRIRASVLESTMQPCPHCGGTGHIRSESSVALLVMRAIEEFLLKDNRHHVTVRTPMSTAIYVLNHKRANLAEMETRFGLHITIEADDSVRSQHYVILRGAAVENPIVVAPPPVHVEVEEDEPVVEIEDDEEVEATEASEAREESRSGGQDGDRKRKRRRRRRGGRDRDHDDAVARPAAGAETRAPGEDDGDEEAEGDDEGHTVEARADDAAAEDAARKKRRRGKRGGRRNRREDEVAAEGATGAEQSPDVRGAEDVGGGEPVAAEPAHVPVDELARADDDAMSAIEERPAATGEPAEPAPRKRAPRRRKAAEPEVAEAAADLSGEAVVDAEAEPAAKPKRRAPRRRTAAPAVEDAVASTQEPADEPAPRAAGIAEPEAAAPAPVAVSAATEPAADIVQEELPPEATEAVPTPEDGQGAAERPAAEPVLVSTGPESADSQEPKARKTGWWQRKSFF